LVNVTKLEIQDVFFFLNLFQFLEESNIKLTENEFYKYIFEVFWIFCMTAIIKNNILYILAFATAAGSSHTTKGGTCMCPIN